MITLLFLLLGCPNEIPPAPKGNWARIPSPEGYTDVDCWVWDDGRLASYSGPICLVHHPE